MRISWKLLLPLVLVIAVVISAAVFFTTTTHTSGQQTAQPLVTSTIKASASRKNVMVAVGDSLTAASNSCGKNDACLQNSWSTGDNPQVDSIATRISAATGQKLTVYNYAHIGDKAEALSTQLPKAIAQKPSLITILIGSNDFCTNSVDQMTAAADFKTTITTAIAYLHASLPEAKIVLSSTVNPDALWSALSSNPKATAKWASGYACQSMLANPTSTATADQQRRQQVIDRSAAFNTILQQACATYPSNCLYSNEIYQFDYNPNLVSTVDYLHPSMYGQAKIADLIASTPGLKQFLLG